MIFLFLEKRRNRNKEIIFVIILTCIHENVRRIELFFYFLVVIFVLFGNESHSRIKMRLNLFSFLFPTWWNDAHGSTSLVTSLVWTSQRCSQGQVLCEIILCYEFSVVILCYEFPVVILCYEFSVVTVIYDCSVENAVYNRVKDL